VKPGEETLTGQFLDERHEEIRAVYLEDQRPWVIGYSGGKDSSTALQLIWYALSDLPREKLTKPLHIISSDTLVETPQIVNYIEASLVKMNDAAQQQGLPFSAHKVQPIIEDSFWVNLIGKGYPAPSQRFRWCTDRLKIQPANRFILDKVAEHGEVVVVLGVRKSESAN
jgi:DNA sulfur modification protein DndC